jgi:hypothetical protein
MNLITVECSRSSEPEGNEPRVGVSIASSPEEAEGLFRAAPDLDGYAVFTVAGVVEGNFPGPARVLGYTGRETVFVEIVSYRKHRCVGKAKARSSQYFAAAAVAI